jgi:hypothetical protein
MGTFIAIAVIIGMVASGAYWLYNRGKQAQRGQDLEKTADVREKQLEEANKPRDPKSVVDSLRSGGF